MANINFRIDEQLKEKAIKVAEKKAITLTDFIKDFLEREVELMEKNIKFELRKGMVQVPYRERKRIEAGFTYTLDEEPEIIKVFENKEEALSELKKFESEIYAFKGASGTVFELTEYYVEENEYDEDDCFVTCRGAWEFSELPQRELDKINE